MAKHKGLLLKGFVTNYIGMDIRLTTNVIKPVDLVVSAWNNPVKVESFDTILCTATLGHLEESGMVLREANVF